MFRLPRVRLFPRRGRIPKGLIPSGRALTGRGRITPGRPRLRTCRNFALILISSGRRGRARPCPSPASGLSRDTLPTIRGALSPTGRGRIIPGRRVLHTCRDSAPIPIFSGRRGRVLPCTSPACGPSRNAPEGASTSTHRLNAERGAPPAVAELSGKRGDCVLNHQTGM